MVKTIKGTADSLKALVFEPLPRNSKRWDHGALVYSLLENVSRSAFPQKPTIAICIKNRSTRTKLTTALNEMELRVISIENGLDVLEYLGDVVLLGSRGITPDLVVTDAKLKGRQGTDLVEGLRQAGWRVPFVILTGKNGKLRTRARMLQMVLGDMVVFEGKYDIDDLLTAIFFLLDRTRKQ